MQYLKRIDAVSQKCQFSLQLLNTNIVPFQAIDALQTAARAKPVASMYMLLGKTQIKAKRFKDSIASFDLALSLYVSSVECSSMTNNKHFK